MYTLMESGDVFSHICGDKTQMFFHWVLNHLQVHSWRQKNYISDRTLGHHSNQSWYFKTENYVF